MTDALFFQLTFALWIALLVVPWAAWHAIKRVWEGLR